MQRKAVFIRRHWIYLPVSWIYSFFAYVSSLHFKWIVHSVDGQATLVDEMVNSRVGLEVQLI